MGPAGELRYPAYPEGDSRWRFPGVGEFQCYDRYMLEDLRARANALDRPEWSVAFCSRTKFGICQTQPQAAAWFTELGANGWTQEHALRASVD